MRGLRLTKKGTIKKSLQRLVVYALKNPINEEVFYVGLSTSSVKIRYQCHLSEAKVKKQKRSRKDDLIKSILDKGLKPTLVILESKQKSRCKVFDVSASEQKWILKFIKAGCNLLNIKTETLTTSKKAIETLKGK